MSLTNSHCAIFNSQCFHYVRFNKCSNTLYSCTEMSKFSNTWIECWNVRMLFKLVCVLLLVFFLHAEVLFVLKMLVAGKRKYNHRTLLEKRQATKMYQLNIMYLRTLYRPGLAKLFDALKKGTNVKRQKVKSGNHESKSIYTIISFHDSRKSSYFCQRIEHWKLSGFRWLATTLKGK